MKIVHTAEFNVGVLRDDGVVDVSSVFEDIPYRSAVDLMPKVMGLLRERKDQIEKIAASADVAKQATILAPVPRPPKLIAAFRNYLEGVSREERRAQDLFMESPDSVLEPGGTVVLPPHDATVFHHEAELGFVIGKRCKDLKADESAYDVLAGYTCAMDVSGRGLGRMGPSRIGKSFDTFTPLGPAVVSHDEIGDPQNLQITLTVNDQVRQTYNTSDMEYSVIETLAFLTSYMTLVPGDVVMLGTNHQGLGPLQHGDHAKMEIEKVGTLEVDVVDEKRRTWPYEVDQAFAARARGVTA